MILGELGKLGENDEALAQQAQQGNREALMKLYDRYLPKVYRRVRSKVPAQQAEDVTQDIFIAVIRSLDRFEQRSRFSTWLYTIVNRQIAEFYRQHYRAHDHQSVSLDAIEGLTLAASPPVELNDERVLVQKAFDRLPDHYQEVILLRFADGQTFAEIADQREQSLEAVKSLYRRAIQALRDQMDGM